MADDAVLDDAVFDDAVLDNAVWHALNGRHAHLAESYGAARRYPTEVAPFGAVGALDAGGWADLAAAARAGSPDDPVTAVLFRAGLGEPPPGWTEAFGGDARQMVLDALAPAPIPPTRPLTAADVPQMLDLVERTRPGPFRTRTIELGGYHGVFDGDRLVAMAGERLRVPGFTEVSAVCTDPDARGRGLASGLSTVVARAILDRGETPFLHHAVGNDAARRVYEELGFRDRAGVRFVSYRPPPAWGG